MRLLFLFFILGITLVSCRKKEEPYLFEMEYFQDFTINAGLGPFTAHYFEFESIPTYAALRFQEHGIEEGDVQSINPRTGSLSSIFEDIDYDFIRSIEIELFDDENGQIVRLPAYYRDPVPDNVGIRVDLVAEETDLQEFLKKDKFNIRIRLELFNAAPKTIESKLIMNFAVR